MKHYFRSVGLILAAAMPLTACGAQTGNVDDTAAVTSSVNEAQSENDKPADDFHKQMVDRSLYSLGNTQRLKAKMEKARSGEETTVAYIGSSITEGAMGGPLGCYAYLSYEYFRDTYGNGDNVKYINAGFSGISSTLGVLRAERDVLSKNADIVFVEFSVNDTMEVVSKEAYESLVRTILETDNEPAVVLLFNRMEGGYSAQPHMKEIGSQYDLPMISVADAITAEFDEGRMTWGGISPRTMLTPQRTDISLSASSSKICIRLQKPHPTVNSMCSPILQNSEQPLSHLHLSLLSLTATGSLLQIWVLLR